MLKRVHVNGYIELPGNATLPEIGAIVTVGKFRAEVTGQHTDKQVRRGDVVEMVITAPTSMLEGAQITNVDPPEDGGLFAGEEKAKV
jgi:hypothetical protein